MNKEQSLALFAKGKDAWNAWAAERRAEREALKAAKTWVESLRERDWNEETGAWHEAAKADFSKHGFEEDANFSGFEFAGDAGFGWAKFKGYARFDGAEFAGTARFDGAEFARYAGFVGAEFAGGARFDGAEFAGYAGFVGAEFAGGARFGGAKFAGDAGFGWAKFKGYAWFAGAEFAGTAWFAGAEFAGYAGFDGAEFAGDAWFGQSLFEGLTSFQGADFLKGASFLAARGERAFSFAGASFLAVPDFEQAHFAEAPRLDNLRIEPGGFWRPTFNRVKEKLKGVTWRTAPVRALETVTEEFRLAAKAGIGYFRGDADLASRWRALKRLAIQSHDHARELDFFRGEIKAARWAKGNFWPTVFSYPYQGFSGFGRSIVLPFIWWLASVGLFACFYLGEHLDKTHPSLSGIEWMSVSLADWTRLEILSTGLVGTLPIGGIDMPDLACIAGPEDAPWQAALSLSFHKSLVFLGSSGSDKLNQIHACLYGVYSFEGGARSAGGLLPSIPGPVALLGLLQLVISSVLLFLFLLAIRNHFRIK